MRPAGVMALLTVALLAAIVAGTAFGAVSVPPSEVVTAMGQALRGQPTGWLARSSSTCAFRGCFSPHWSVRRWPAPGRSTRRSSEIPLADPYILGISSGAGLGAMIALVATAGATALRFGVVPVAAFAGAMLTMLLVVRLANVRGRLDPTSLLLAGVALSYTLAAVTSFVMVLAREQMAAIVYWMMGGFSAATWGYVWMIAPMFVLGIVVPLFSTRELDLMLLGDERAGHLGLSVERFKLLMLAAASLLTAAAVAVAGLIGFVGLMVPHMVRLVLGPDHRRLLPASLLVGAIVLVLADLIARTVIAPIEIPVGIVTAVLGGPFFIWLLVRGERSR